WEDIARGDVRIRPHRPHHPQSPPLSRSARPQQTPRPPQARHGWRDRAGRHGPVMKKERGNRRAKEHCWFVRLSEWFLACPAWQSLDGNARALYIEMARRYRGPNSTNGRIPFSVREAAVLLHVVPDTAARAFNALMERGFIRITRNSKINVEERASREWLLTEFPDDRYGRLSESPRDFMRWKPGAQNSFHSTITGTHSPSNRTELSR